MRVSQRDVALSGESWAVTVLSVLATAVAATP
jgi:hypothetical protein